MKFTLKDYQDEAVGDVLRRLATARKHWHDDGLKSAFSLTATTGAGKTVMAASVFESLFFGNDDYDFALDPGAVVIWFSDDPSLNEQSRWRLQEASDKLTLSNLVTVDNSFAADAFEPGKVYFLNTQKFSKNSLLVRGYDQEMQPSMMPDARQYTIWDVIRNTVDDPDLTLYLVLDEAHKGMRENTRNTADKPTIVKQLINGSNGTPGIPIVLGVSATVQRFNDAMQDMQERNMLPSVKVNTKKVQESGLLKDTINLDVPDETGDFTTVLLRRATDKLKEISDAWEDYGEQQDDADIVKPLMVLQVPNTPDPNEIAGWLDTIFETWPDLPRDSVANVFGEHATETFGGHEVPYIAPERVQQDEWVRILIAKDAISTGWDCPRAEVMVSLRRAVDQTHITQLLGRMVRTPLARRIPGNERLNAVDCLLPHFDKESVTRVADELMTGESGEELPGRRVLINPREMTPNPNASKAVWDKFISLPSQTLPKQQTRPIKRLTSLAHELAADGLLKDAGKKAHAEMHKVIDGALVRYKQEIEDAKKSVMTVEGMTVTADTKTQEKTFNEFVDEADYRVIEDAYRAAARGISPDLATTYSEHLADRNGVSDDYEEALIEAHIIVASIGLVPEIKTDLEAEASKLANLWLQDYRVKIKSLNDERQEVYRQIREMSDDPLDVDLAPPTKWLQMTKVVHPDGKEEDLPRFENHLLCDESGLFPAVLNGWEERVLKTEMEREDAIAWYRNPARASQDSLGVTYEQAGEIKIVRPDFVFFAKLPDGSIAADIVDPHGTFMNDSLPRLQGIAKYIEANPSVYRRVEVCAEIDGTFRTIDLSNKSARNIVNGATNIEDVYRSEIATEY